MTRKKRLYMRIYMRKWRKLNPEKHAEYMARWRKKNPKAWRAISKRSSKKYHADPVRHRRALRIMAKWRKDHPEKIRGYYIARQARLKQAKKMAQARKTKQSRKQNGKVKRRNQGRPARKISKK